ncbi:hypothetical protein HZS55_04355 [Halosimplex rubrum]|uniref:DUF7096 domain-containing protein n=1 Tax=Halosimplex rubrum TaxID=869889 RepID=A0A7D5NYN0_9EURY|nr:hypothetical protein [Halosimplex rubrum]QLH76583.1 hypothetical protein HZS55_04355 [Halosimplex rubrum]
MDQVSPVAAALLVVLAAVGAVPVAALSGSGLDARQTAANETANESLAPGERFAGVVGVEQAEISGELEARAFGQRIAAARSNASTAGVVADEVSNLNERLAELDGRMAELERAHENGTLSEGQYRARLARVHAEQRALQRQVNQTEYVARELPAAALEAKGVNVSAIETLRTRASEMSGPEVAAIARSIAGKNAGSGMGGPPEQAGPPAFVQNRTSGPGAPGNGNGGGQGNGGPPADAGSNNETGPPADVGPNNETGPPADVGPNNETGPPANVGPNNETGQPADAGASNQTGSPADADQNDGTERAGNGGSGGSDDGAGGSNAE